MSVGCVNATFCAQRDHSGIDEGYSRGWNPESFCLARSKFQQNFGCREAVWICKVDTAQQTAISRQK